MTLFVLVHSPSVGPATWAAVAERLTIAGCDVAVPSLLTVGEDGPPFWPRAVAAVTGKLGTVRPDQLLVLAAHSNAGIFLPVIRHALEWPVALSVFVDATIPVPDGRTPMVGEEFLPFLRDLAGPDGRLPPWTDWWDEEDVAPMFADQQTREVITAEQPRLPLAYYQEQVPVPAGWDDHPCAYVQFSSAYDAPAAEARRRGWDVRLLPGEHLHQVVDPDAVARTLLDLAFPGGRDEHSRTATAGPAS
jgi:hypothetical protein